MKRLLKRIKLVENGKVKGFTLIELIAVIVIMGLIIIVVIPTISKMIHNNNNDKYSNYYQLIEEGARAYAGTLTDKLGNSKNSGCVEITLDELIDKGYIKPFDDKDKKVTTGSGNIKIRNNKGNITVNFQLSFSSGGKNEFITGSNDANICNAYVMDEEINLKTKIDNALLTVNKNTVGTEVYVVNNNPNNYIWYSGKLWRVVSYSKVTEVVRAVTAESITSIYYNHNKSSSYLGSDVGMWLENEFLPSLKDNQLFLTNVEWNYTPNTDPGVDPKNKIKKSKVGLLSTFDYGKVKPWYDGIPTWLLSEGINNNGLITDPTSAGGSRSPQIVQQVSLTSIYPIRPVIAFSSDVLVYGNGNGTKENPYIIDNSANATGKKGDLINTRFSGEYVRVNGRKYRIISIEGDKAKLISTTSINDNIYSDNHFDYASSNLYENLSNRSEFKSDLITTGDFCLDTINNDNLVYRSYRCLDSSRINNGIKVGLPKIGDVFTTNIEGITNNYWTLNPNTEKDSSGNHYGATMNLITPNGTNVTSLISEKNAAVPVIYLDSSVKISSGNGQSSSPYNVEK